MKQKNQGMKMYTLTSTFPFQVIDIFYQQASTVLLTHLLFATLIYLLSYTKIYNRSSELS